MMSTRSLGGECVSVCVTDSASNAASKYAVMSVRGRAAGGGGVSPGEQELTAMGE